MKFTDRLYWFGKNFSAYIFYLVFFGIHSAWEILYHFINTTRILFITDGSEEIRFPWEWKWRLWDIYYD